MNIGEANAYCKVVDWLRRLTIASDPDVSTFEIEALEFLAERAGKALWIQVEAPDAVAVVKRLVSADSDGAAQAVCRALAAHESHGGSIPWPSVRRPFDDWQAAHATAGEPRSDP